MTDYLSLKIVFILTIGFAFASLLGYLAYRIKLSPLLGYLVAGYLIGPHSPGFVADMEVAGQLSEIGVILMMFGVGLHFKWQYLVNVRHVAVPGALLQTAVATFAGTVLMMSAGWPLEGGILFGLAIGVASTVVLVRILSDYHLLNTAQGHLAVGWLIVEDLITVLVLLLIPTLAPSSQEGGVLTVSSALIAILFILIKFTVLIALMFTVGRRLVLYALSKVLLTKSHELFTLTMLAITFIITMSCTLLFGTSIALGAFIAGMVIGQTHVRHQVSSNTTPLKDTFVVIFFLSVGMLFSPSVIREETLLFSATLGIILILKPLAALLITTIFRSPFKNSLVVAISLAQIGEFSFILADQAVKFHLFPQVGADLLVACSLISISLNPVLFKMFKLGKEVGAPKQSPLP